MKKFAVLCLCLFIVVSFSGCDKTSDGTASTDSNASDISSTAEQKTEEEPESNSEVNPITAFSCVDIDGNEISSNIYGDYDLTLINIFATWCPPCIAELPEMASLYEDIENEGVNFLAFVIDTVGMDGGVDEDAINTAMYLRDEAGADFKMIVPDETFMNGLLAVHSVPTTFFVDKNGNIVGDAIVGANDYDTWHKIILERLASL